MSENVCIHQSLQKRIIQEVDDSMNRFQNHFEELLCDLEETRKLFQLDDCRMLMEEGDDPPYCQVYRDVFRTLHSSLYDIWDHLKTAMITLHNLRRKTNVERKPTFNSENVDLRKCFHFVTTAEQEDLPIHTCDIRTKKQTTL